MVRAVFVVSLIALSQIGCGAGGPSGVRSDGGLTDVAVDNVTVDVPIEADAGHPVDATGEFTQRAPERGWPDYNPLTGVDAARA